MPIVHNLLTTHEVIDLQRVDTHLGIIHIVDNFYTIPTLPVLPALIGHPIRSLTSTKRTRIVKKNRILLSVIMTVIAAVAISSCTYRSYEPGYDYGYRHGYRYYHAPPPPPRVVVVKPAPRVIYADRHHYRRHDNRTYRKQYRRNDHYGNNGRHRGPRR